VEEKAECKDNNIIISNVGNNRRKKEKKGRRTGEGIRRRKGTKEKETVRHL
jgi:hypothetical protein